MSISLVNSSREMASFPNGKKEKLPITIHARPQGIPMMLIKAKIPKNHHSNPINTPPNTNQMMLPSVLILFPLLLNVMMLVPEGDRNVKLKPPTDPLMNVSRSLIHLLDRIAA
ncbi:hypothetical protein VDIAB_100311 [Vibrio diabolicus]|nr:hypothetical protein VDIAB_100311 [Vibrio diabolicus]